MLVLNAFSANMLAEFPASVQFAEVSAAEASQLLAVIEADGDTWASAVGNADTAAVMTAELNKARPQDGHVVTFSRNTVQMRPGDRHCSASIPARACWRGVRPFRRVR